MLKIQSKTALRPKSRRTGTGFEIYVVTWRAQLLSWFCVAAILRPAHVLDTVKTTLKQKGLNYVAWKNPASTGLIRIYKTDFVQILY